VINIECRPTFERDDSRRLRSGDAVEISGSVLTIRDASAKRIFECVESGKHIPPELDGALLYAVGPSPAKPGQIIGSAGPTTVSRFSTYLPALFNAGARGIIAKGELHGDIVQMFMRYEAVYLAAIGGLGALLGKTIKACDTVAFPDLGPEALLLLEVERLPAVVIIDSLGTNFHEAARARWRQPQ
jgi:fumarate hydratase subunit beta